MERDSALLADEMGLGKTVQAITAMQVLLDMKKLRRVLIVCPTSLCLNWELELGKWTPETRAMRIMGGFVDRKAYYMLPFKLWITSYEQVRADIDFLARQPKYDIVIIDEAQRIKNANSEVAVSCKQIPRDRSWALTGTPLENRPEELVSIFGFVRSGLLFAGLDRKETHSRIAPWFLRRCKKEVLQELPPIIVQDLVLEMTSHQRQAYDEEFMQGRTKMQHRRGSVEVMGLLKQINQLKQICNFEPSTKDSCKIDALMDIIGNLNSSDKVIVFSQYVKTLYLIRENIKGLPVDLFHGNMSQQEKAEVIDRFENSPGPRVLLISLRAGGVGLNLGTASLVILFDRWWNPAVEDQAIQRAHRFGRTKALHVVQFVVQNSVEEKIAKILDAKKEIFQDYIEEADIADVAPFTREELVQVLGMSE